MKRIAVCGVVLLFLHLAAGLANPAGGQTAGPSGDQPLLHTYAMPSWTVDAGGAAYISTGRYTLGGTASQPDAAEGQTSGAYTLRGGFWSPRCAAGAAIPALTVTRDGNDVLLGWDANPLNTQYQVWVSASPYFDPAVLRPTAVTAALTYRDTGAAVDLVNHYYSVRGLNACGAASADSAAKGEFTFSLTRGG